ncbi:MAG: hypothetical protein ABIJ03_01040 [Patescibacteria group bacterium]
MNIYPAILTGDLVKAQSELNECKKIWEHFGTDNFSQFVVQMDVIDGQFADNLTLTPVDLAQLDFGQLKADLHLMTEEPLNDVYELHGVKEQVPVRAVIAQIERMSHQADFIEEVRKKDWWPGFSLDAFTPLSEIDETSWSQLKLVQLMGIEAGFQNQKFLSQVLNKIEELVALRLDKGLEFEIVVDGGVKEECLVQIKAVGADSVAVGSAIWSAKDKIEAYQQFINLLD